MRKTYLGLLIIVCVGAYVRFQSLGYDLPNAYNPDDVYTMEQAVAVADGSYSEALSSRQPLHTILIGLSIRTASMINPSMKNHAQPFVANYRQDKRPFFLIARTVVASFSVATIIALFFLGYMLAGSAVGLLSALVYSMNVLEIQYAHELYAETILMLMVTVTLVLLVQAWRKNRFSLLVYGALLIALASLQKVFAIFLLPIYIPIYTSVVRGTVGNAQVRMFRYLILIAVVSVTVYLAYPVLSAELLWLSTNKWLQDTTSYGDPLVILQTDYRSHILAVLTRLRDSMGLFPFLMSIIGIYISIRRSISFLLILSAFIIFYIFIIAIMLPDWDTNLLMIFPIMSMLAGLGMYGSSTFLASLLRTKIIGYGCITVLMVPVIIKSYWFSASYSIPDTRTREVLWMKDHAVDPSSVARDGLTGVTLPPPGVLTSKLSREQLDGFDYVVLSSWYSKHFSEPERKTPELALLYEGITTRYEKVAEFTPTGVDPFVDDVQLLTNPLSWQHLQYTRGPLITIYKRPPTL